MPEIPEINVSEMSATDKLRNVSQMSATDKLVMIFSFYRDAELRGARLLFNLLHHLKDGAAQLKMSRHLADETRHAWLWTKRIDDLGAAPVMIDDGYQRRLGLRTGVPKDLIDLLALTVVVEERARSRYVLHAAMPHVDQETLAVLKAVTEDETWHLSWIERQMHEIARKQGNPQRANQALERYRAIDREVYATLAADEAFLMKA
ncbi:MAG TPA: ferritin-like domain-containing protein [Candidatus Binataceae bacterium]|jgi:bacterioferritin (cytochrome b1)|nr:ferritin-like domain-containing protein [Candidatus Binataceae bacterium]